MKLLNILSKGKSIVPFKKLALPVRSTEQSSLLKFLNKVTRALISSELHDPFILGSSLAVPLTVQPVRDP